MYNALKERQYRICYWTFGVASFKIPNWFRHINEREWFCFRLSSTLYYKCHKLNFRRGGSYIHSTDKIKKKKSNNVNLKNTDDECFQYAKAVALNYEEVKWNRIKPFINKYNWKKTNYPSKID